VIQIHVKGLDAAVERSKQLGKSGEVTIVTDRYNGLVEYYV